MASAFRNSRMRARWLASCRQLSLLEVFKDVLNLVHSASNLSEPSGPSYRKDSVTSWRRKLLDVSESGPNRAMIVSSVMLVADNTDYINKKLMHTVVLLFKDHTRLINLHQQCKICMKILRMLYKFVHRFGEEVSSILIILINSDDSMRRCIK